MCGYNKQLTLSSSTKAVILIMINMPANSVVNYCVEVCSYLHYETQILWRLQLSTIYMELRLFKDGK